MATTFTRTENGRTRTRVAHTPAEAVRLRFDGWTELEAAPPPRTPAGPAPVPPRPAPQPPTNTDKDTTNP